MNSCASRRAAGTAAVSSAERAGPAWVNASAHDGVGSFAFTATRGRSRLLPLEFLQFRHPLRQGAGRCPATIMKGLGPRRLQRPSRRWINTA
jgi:hypothetical protein